MFRFILFVNKQGQTRLSRYYFFPTVRERAETEAELIRRCLLRPENVCNFFSINGTKVIYRRYASLYFIVGVEDTREENELAILEWIHNLVETLDRYFENICELDIMFNVEKAHFILDEMVSEGRITETNRVHALSPLILMDKHGG